MTSTEMDQPRPESLSPREAECVRLSLTHSDKEIAAQLGIAVPTVKTHLATARRKLQVTLKRRPARAVSEADWGHSSGTSASGTIPGKTTAEPFDAAADHPIGADPEQIVVREERAVFGPQPRPNLLIEALHDLNISPRVLLMLVAPVALLSLILIAVAVFANVDHVLPRFYPGFVPK